MRLALRSILSAGTLAEVAGAAAAAPETPVLLLAAAGVLVGVTLGVIFGSSGTPDGYYAYIKDPGISGYRMQYIGPRRGPDFQLRITNPADVAKGAGKILGWVRVGANGPSVNDNTPHTAPHLSPTPRTIPVAPTEQPVAAHVVSSSWQTSYVLTQIKTTSWKDDTNEYTRTDRWYTPVTRTTYHYSDGTHTQGAPTNGKPFDKWTLEVNPIFDFEHPHAVKPAPSTPPPPNKPPGGYNTTTASADEPEENSQPLPEDASGDAAEDEIGLARYADGRGHHIPAKSGFRGANGFDPAEAPAVPNAELSRLGINHATITGAQARLYSAFARGGGDLTWDAMQSIETQAMIAGGAEAGAAQSVVARAIAALQDAGVSGPTRIPWGG